MRKRMIISRSCLWAALAALLCAGCYPARMTTVPGASGILIDSHTLQPIRGAEVAIHNPRDNGQPMPERPPVASKKNGHFSVGARHRLAVVWPLVVLWTASGDLHIQHDGYTPLTIPLFFEKGGRGMSLVAPPAMALGKVLAADFTDPPGLAAKLRAGHDPLSAYLFSHFSPDSQRAVADSSVRSDILRGVLARELNSLVSGAAIYDADRFRGVTLSEQTEELLDYSRSMKGYGLSDAESRREFPAATAPAFTRSRVNRRLLMDAYPGALLAGGAPGRRLDGNLGVILLDPVKNQTARN